MRRVALIGLLVLTVGACGLETPTLRSTAGPEVVLKPSGAPEPGASAGVPSASGEVAPAAMTVDEAAAAYLAIAGPHNKRNRELFRRFKGDQTLKVRQREWLLGAKEEKRFADDLKALVWPMEVRADVEKLVRLSVIFERRARAVADSRNWPDLLEAAKAGDKAGDAAADQASLVRDILGLPSN